MVLEEKGLGYSVVEEDLSNPSPELLRHHPEGRVPLLIHGENVIYESSVITEYLDEAFPQHPLMPTSAGERARIRLWTYWCNSSFKIDLDAFKYEWLEQTPEEQEALKERLALHLKKLDEALEHSEFLMGSQLTLADIHLFPFYRQLQKAQPFFHDVFNTKTRNLESWLSRITSRPTFERVMKKES
jgi:glutathione S-transferase